MLFTSACAFTVSDNVFAGNVSGPGNSATVGSGDPVESWNLSNGATLNVTAGGQTAAISSNNSTVNLTGASVENNAGTSNGVGLVDSQATINNSQINAKGGAGLMLGSAGASGSTATVSNSTISSASSYGVWVGDKGTLTLSNTQVSGGTSGMLVARGIANISNGSRIVGQINGITASNAGAALPGLQSQILIDASHVEGTAGAAILVTNFRQAVQGAVDITVQNGATVTGGNGNLLEVSGNGTVANFTVDNSHLTGNIVVDGTSSADVTLRNNASLTGQLTNVANLAVNSGAAWNMTDSASVQNVALAGGNINLSQNGSAFHQLDIGQLSGNGTFGMRVNLAALQGDFLNVSGTATGEHALAIQNTGVEPDKGAGQLQVVQTQAGDATFHALGNNGMVDAGTYQYRLEQQGNAWYLVQAQNEDGDPVVTPSAAAVLGLFNTASTVWYGEDVSLRSRMGELRFNPSADGAWVRSYGSRYNVDGSAGQAYKQTQYGFSAGADKAIPVADGKLFVGVLGGYSRNNLDFGSATTGSVDSFYAGGYLTWFGKDGYYADGVLKGNVFSNDAKVQMSDGTAAKGDYTNYGLGTSLEFGRQITLTNAWFVEPSIRLSAFMSSGASIQLDNGLQASGNPDKSLQARIGTALGRNLELSNGNTLQPYVKVGVVQELVHGNGVNVNGNHFDNDLAGTRGEVGVGFAARTSQAVQLYGDFLYSKGPKLTQPWGVNLGLRYQF